MPYSSNLTDKEWELIKPLVPRKKKTKPPTWSKRQIFKAGRLLKKATSARFALKASTAAVSSPTCARTGYS